jgi:predicted regulator of Ras-like GTPase activity (Roadblock/LC7/MglB family)
VDATPDRQRGELSKESARRVALALGKIDGVHGVLVASREGRVLDAQGQVDGARDAALASFLGSRAEALAIDGDLRGMGRMLAGSRLESITISGPGQEAVLLPAADGYVMLPLAPGRTATAVGPQAASTLRRYL